MKKKQILKANLKYFKIDEDNFILKTNNDLKGIFKRIKILFYLKMKPMMKLKHVKILKFMKTIKIHPHYFSII